METNLSFDLLFTFVGLLLIFVEIVFLGGAITGTGTLYY